MRYEFGDVTLDLLRHELRRDGEPIAIEPQVFDVLSLLVVNRERMLAKTEILDTIWGDQFVSESALSSRIKSARQAVGDNGRDQHIIRTVHGRGFRFVADVVEVDSDAPDAPGHVPAASPGVAGEIGEAHTFLFTDIEGSTRLWGTHGEDMREALRRHDELVQRAATSAGGVVFKHTGDGFAIAFEDSSSALNAAVAIQFELQARDWSPLSALPVRVAAHRGDARATDGDFFGHTVSTTARLLAAANGGQIVASEAAVEAFDTTESVATVIPAGAFRLPDIGDHELLYLVDGPGLQVDPRPLRALVGKRTNLPRHRQQLIGRSDEVARALEQIQSSEIVSIVGTGGAGKTTMALTLGRELLATHRGGVWLCELASVTSEQVPAAVLDSLAGSAGSGLIATEQILDRLGHEPVVLILDNCEQVIEAAAKLTEQLVESAPNLTVLATSREALDVRGEQVLRIEGLARGSGDGPAVELFFRRASEVTDLQQDDATRALVTEIADRLEGLPLAIELAAPRLATLTLAELLEALGDQLSVLRSRRRYESRQAAMDDAISWSVDLLSEAERTTLLELGVFVGAFTADAAAAVCSDDAVRRMLHRLVEQSVVSRVELDRVSRYRLLEPIRQFASTRIDPAAADPVNERHARYFAEHVTSLATDMRGPNEPHAAEALTAEWHDFGKALAWGRDNNDPEIAFSPLIALEFHLLWQLRIEGFMWLEAASEALGEQPGRQPSIDFVRAIGAWAANDLDRSQTLLTAAVEASGWTAARAFLRFIQAFARNDAPHLLEAGDQGWELAQSDDDETWIMATAAFRLISRAIHDPSDPDIGSLADEVDRQIELNDWPTGLCLGLLSHLTRSVQGGSMEEARPLAESLARVAGETHVPWFPMTAGSLMANLLTHDDPLTQLEVAARTARTAIDAGELVQMPAFLRAMFVALEATNQLSTAANILGLIPRIHGVGEDGVFSPGYDDAVARVRDQLEPAELTRLLGEGQLLSLEEASALGDQALDDATRDR